MNLNPCKFYYIIRTVLRRIRNREALKCSVLTIYVLLEFLLRKETDRPDEVDEK